MNDTNNKYTATNVLAKLIFQDHTDQDEDFFRTDSKFQDFYRSEFFSSFSGLCRTRLNPGMCTGHDHSSPGIESQCQMPMQKCVSSVL